MKPGRCSLHQLLISNSALLPLLWSPHFFSLLQESCKTRGDLSHLQPSKESGTTFSCSKATSISWSPWWQQPLLSCFAPASSNHSGRERLPPNCPPRIPFSQLCQGSTEQIRLSFIPNVVYLKKKKKNIFSTAPWAEGGDKQEGQITPSAQGGPCLAPRGRDWPQASLHNHLQTDQPPGAGQNWPKHPLPWEGGIRHTSC